MPVIMRLINNLSIWMACVLAFSMASKAQAQMIKGEIVCEDGPLPGVTIRITPSNQGCTTNLDGQFSYQFKDNGSYELSISYIGYKDILLPITVKEGVNSLGVITLQPDELLLGEVVINGTMAPSQRKAYDIKKNSIAFMDIVAADAVGKLPDRNAAEAVQRVQGVAVARYHGEADQATVRGTPFAWTSTLFNGNRLPSSNVMGNRSSVLDAIPSELIQYVQVAKALTPDWEGDAIGGSINFITRTAPTKRKLGVSLAGGYNDFSENGTYNGSIVYGDRFFNNKLGIIFVGAIWERKWGSDSFDVSYNTSAADPVQRNAINSVMLKRYMGTRQTYGLNLNMEYKFNDNHKIFFRGLHDKFNDTRPVYESYVDYAKSSFTYQYRYSDYQTKLDGGEISGEHQLTSKLSMDWGYSDYTSKFFLDTPKTSDQKGLPIATFKQKITGGFNNLSSDGLRYWDFDSPDGIGGAPLSFDPGVSESMDPTKLTLQQMVLSKLDTKEHDRNFQLNFKYDLNAKLKFKAGGKYRTKSRNNTFGTNYVFVPNGSKPLIALADMQTEKFPSGSTFFSEMNGNYDAFKMNPITKHQLFELFDATQMKENGFMEYPQPVNETAAYEAKEKVTAGYAMFDYQLSDQWKFVGGFRNEYTHTTLHGKRLTTNSSGEQQLDPIKTENNYNAFLPMFHIKYSPTENSNIRFAYTRTFVRPNFNDMSPGSSVDESQNPIIVNKGNEDLNPSFSNNIDVMAEYYFDNVGLISGGIFYKGIKDVIFTNIEQYTENNRTYRVTQAKNLKSAKLYGFEAGINRRFDFLPGFLSGLGAEVNYTYIESNVKVPRHTTVDGKEVIVNDKTTLPDQSRNMANAILFYEKSKVMVRIAGNYRGKSINTINQELGPDFYVRTAKNFTVDASATVDIAKNTKVFVELNNLTNESLKQYMGDKKRITSCEWYGTKGQIGIRWDIFK